MNYLDDINYLFLNKKKLEKNEILGNFIYYTIFSLIYIYYFNI